MLAWFDTFERDTLKLATSLSFNQSLSIIKEKQI